MTIKRYRLILIRAPNHHLAIIPLIICSRLRDWLGISAKCCYSGHFRALIRHHRQVLAKSGYFHGRKSVRLYKNFSFAIIDCKSLQLSSSECRDNGNGKQTKARTRNKLEDAQAGFQAALLCSTFCARHGCRCGFGSVEHENPPANKFNQLTITLCDALCRAGSAQIWH